MNGSRSTFMRKGYLLTALAAAVLLAASSGTAWAQGVTIGFTETSGMVEEAAVMNLDALRGPTRVTVRAQGLAGPGRSSKRMRTLDTVTIIATGGDVTIEVLNAFGTTIVTGDVEAGGVDETADVFTLPAARFDDEDELVLLVTPKGNADAGGSANTGDDIGTGDGDNNWRNEMVQLKLSSSGTASVSPDVYRLTINDDDTAPVAEFDVVSFTLTEGAERDVSLSINAAPRARMPGAVLDDDRATGGVIVRVSNSRMVTAGACPPARDADGNPNSLYGRYAIGLNLGADGTTTEEWDGTDLGTTGLLTTNDNTDVLATAAGSADMLIEACGDMAGIADPEVTLTILKKNLVESGSKPVKIGDITIGPPLTITVESDEALPTLSFSPTDVTIDEGGSTETVLLADGPNADDVGMVKLSVEGEAMVSLMQDGEMLEEMGGYVYVDLKGSNSARLMAMSHSDPDLMDGEMAFKAWKLMEGGTDGAAIGEGYWFKVDVRGSTAVPALPLVGQLLLALFLMAGGARLYRRRQG